jgi:zinc protease
MKGNKMTKSLGALALIFAVLAAGLIVSPAFGQTQKNYGKYIHEILPNGMTLIISYNPDSRVYAINILGKNRSANEPAGKDGITDFVNRMMTQGADSMNAETIQNKLDDIGATVTANDNPYIPYDDRYTTRAYSFIKFETIDEYAGAGTKLLYQIVAKPDFPDEEIAKTQKKVMGILGMTTGSTYQTARDLMYKTLFAGNPFEKTVMGSPMTVGMFTRDDLVTYHKHFYAPNNIIMAVATNLDPDSVKAWIYSTFGKMQNDPTPYADVSAPAKPSGINEVHQEMAKEQIYIYMGTLTPGLKSADAPAINMASSIISTRMQLDLREKQGLAYSVGMDNDFMPDFGWVVAAMGTGYKNYDVAKKGMIGEIDSAKSSLPSDYELQKAQNSTWGSMLLARASRINQAYYMCRNEFLGVGFDYETDYIAKIRKVTTVDVQRVTKDYFDTANMVIATAGKKAE